MSVAEADETRAEAAAERAGPVPYSLWELVRYFLRLGTIGFGGPVALIEYMRRDLVEERGWIPAEEYRDGLALSQLAPGPLAAQLATYLGYVHYGVLGATLVSLAFVLPSFVMVVALGWAYTAYGGLSWVQAVFYSVGAAVIGIIAHSAYKLTRSSIGRDRLRWAIYLVSAAVTIITESEIIWLFFAAGVVVWLAKAPPARWRGKRLAAFSGPVTPLALMAAGGDAGMLGRIFGFFLYAGSFVFGSGLAIVPFLYGGLVKERGWLTDHQFLDAVAVALITPGPVVITTGFIGYLLAGLAGASVAAVATFLPAYLLTILPAPYFKRYGRRPEIAAFVDGVTAAAIGAISGAVVVLGRRSVVDLPTVLIAVVVLALLWKKKVPEPLVVLVAALVGLVVHPLVRG
jgi:chromate transporter